MERERRQYAKMEMVLASSSLKGLRKSIFLKKQNLEFGQWTKDLMSLYKSTKMIKIMEGHGGFTFQRAQRKVTSCFLY